MTGMKHTIEQAVEVLDAVDRNHDLDSGDLASSEEYARALAEAGLLSPAPLREEWAAAWEGHGATRIGLAQESPEDIEGIPPGGWVVHRYVTAWEPQESDDE